MKILFSKITSSPKNYHIDIEDIGADVVLSKNKSNLVKADIELSGKIALECNRCLGQYDKIIQDKLELVLSDKEYTGRDSLDVIEFFDGKIDIDFLINSEIQLYKDDYNICSLCQELDNYEIEY